MDDTDSTNKPQKKYTLREYKNHISPDFYGSLERDQFLYLGEWTKVIYKNGNYGFYHKVGIKEGIKDSEGDLAVAFLYFIKPFINEGHAMTSQIENTIEKAVRDLVKESAIQFSKYVGNAICAVVPTPDYMNRELADIVLQQLKN